MIKLLFFSPQHTRTAFITLDTRKCRACWACLGNCSVQAIGRVNLPWHKHALFVRPDVCTGCLTCVDTCPHTAYSVIDRTKKESRKKSKHTLRNFVINNLLGACGLALIFSGLVLQLGYHLGGSPKVFDVEHSLATRHEQFREIDIGRIVFGFRYPAWSDIHKSLAVVFSLLMIWHTYHHWKWYKSVIGKRLMGKHKQVIWLSVIFLLAAFTGLTPWVIGLSEGPGHARMLFIEIHDKITLLLIVFLALHFIKRAGWFSREYVKLKKEAV